MTGEHSRSTKLASPWFTALAALAIGLLTGFLVPQKSAERERLRPFASRFGGRLRTGVRRFADRSISEGLGRR